MIDLAKFMGRLIMPQSAAEALLTHGTLRLLRLTAAMRRYFDDLGIKPKNVFPQGSVRRGPLGREARRAAVRCRRAGFAPPAATFVSATKPSDPR